MNTIDKYLSRYAEPETGLALPGSTFDAAIAIPASRESAEDIINVTAALPGLENLLVIVVNNVSDSKAHESAATTHSALIGNHELIQLGDNIALVKSGTPDRLLVDRFSEGRTISSRQGVGIARKIACDIALTLHHKGIVRQPWIYTTDADATLPANYIGEPEAEAVARIPLFQHIPATGHEIAVPLYDIRLLYHVAAQCWAGSPYTHTSIGSLMTFSPGAYAAVRGVPRRSTGEDFYLLNKLRKLGGIAMDSSVVVTLAGRASDRVPIGTGQALGRISALGQPNDEYLFEHPACFDDLREFIKGLELLANDQPAGFRWQDDLFHAWSGESGFYAHYERKRDERPTPAVLRKHLDDWFDGLKTRQLVHRLRDERHGAVHVLELGKAPFVPGSPTTIDDIREALFDAVYRPGPRR